MNPVIPNKHKGKKQALRSYADPLPVMEHFYSLQGEGSWSGTPAYFVRLAGCNVGCHWCDVKESWQINEDQLHSCEQLNTLIAKTATERVIITGGEPTLHDLTLLTETFQKAGLQVHMETAGTNPIKGKFDWICLSPKKFLPPLPENYALAAELKVIIFNRHDFKWAEEHAARCPEHVELFLQPEWSRRAEMTPLILDYVRKHPRWRLSLQTHKYLGIR